MEGLGEMGGAKTGAERILCPGGVEVGGIGRGLLTEHLAEALQY